CVGVVLDHNCLPWGGLPDGDDGAAEAINTEERRNGGKRREPGSNDSEPRAPRFARAGGARIQKDESRSRSRWLSSFWILAPPASDRRSAGARRRSGSNYPALLRFPPLLRSSV